MTTDTTDSSSRTGRSRRSKAIDPDLMKPGEDWRNVPDSTERRKIQNRIAQRSYRRGMRARKNEIEQLKQQLHQYTGQRTERQSSSASPTGGQKRSAAAASDKSQSTASPRESLRSSIGDVSHDIAVLDMNNHNDSSIFTVPSQSYMQPGSAEPPRAASTISVTSSKPLNDGPQSISGPLSDANAALQSRNVGVAPHTHDRAMTELGKDSAWDESLFTWTPDISSLSAVECAKETLRDMSTPSLTSAANQITSTSAQGPSTSLLHLSIASGNCDIVNMLLQDDEIYVDEKDPQGFTALQRAVILGRADMVAILLEHGAAICSSGH